MTLLWSIIAQALKHPHRVAVRDDRRAYTFKELLGGAMFLAERIDAATSARNVGLMLPPSGLFPVALLGAWLARRVVVPINYLLHPEELAYIIRDSDVDTIVAVQPMLDFLGGPGVIPAGVKLVLMESIDFSGLPPLRWPPRLGDDEVAALVYTSGTSAKPKGVMLTHGNLHSNALAGIRHSRVTSASSALAVLPQFHSYGLTILTVLPLLVPLPVIYTARFVPKKVVSLIREHQIDLVIAVPSMYAALLSVKDAGPEDFKSVHLAVSGGEPLPNAVYEEFQRRFGIQLREGYGLTETSPVLTWATPFEAFKLHSVGQALPGVELAIVDEQGAVLGPDRDGEVLAAGPCIMKGYYKLPEATAAVFTELDVPDGRGGMVRRKFFRTGDIGRLDADGFLFITGRKKELLKVAGEIVFPREVEELLAKHPMVHAVAVIGKHDDVRGEVPVAYVEVQEGQTFDEAALRAYCREHIATYKVPREIHCVDQLPRSAAGKVLKRFLKTD